MSLRSEYCASYYDKRQTAIQASRIVIVLGLTFLAISCSPKFRLNFGAFDGGISSGYVVVYGPWILFAISAWYYTEVVNCLGFRGLLIDAIHRGELGEENTQSNIEEFQLSAPHIAAPQFGGECITRWRNICAPHLPLTTSILCYCWLMFEYFRFHHSPDWVGWPEDILWGVGFAEGFDPIWARSGGHNMPWVYPPYYTVIYLVMLVALVYFYRQQLVSYRFLAHPQEACDNRTLSCKAMIQIFAACVALVSIIAIIAAW